jgi:hypothetical protein
VCLTLFYLFVTAAEEKNSMISKILKSVFGSRNDRLLKQYRQTVARINALEPEILALSDEALRAKTAEFKQRVQQGESLDAILPEAFAVVREGGKRSLQMRHFDVQLIGGMVLHYGKIAEMRTGEGKTLMDPACLPECIVRQGCARGDGERLPGIARCRMDGQTVPVPRPVGRRHPDQHGTRG